MTMRKAKIVCTIGPASGSPEMLDRLIESGMDAARLNFSHGTHESHGRAIKAIREAASRRRAAVSIMQDLQGPRIRVGALSEAGMEVHPGQVVRLVTMDWRSGGQIGAHSAAAASLPEIPVMYPNLAKDLRPGAQVLIDDGSIELLVTRLGGGSVECKVMAGGRIRSHKGINLPGTRITTPTITEKDRDDLRFGIAHGVDYLAFSFVRGPEDVQAAKRLISECGGDLPVIAKIERAEAVASLDAILDLADGVMIARGDLGVELGPEAVPILQKQIIAQANRRRRLVITATQMLESMTYRNRPTRAEASDVANAVFDGTDALMLSAETAVGEHPVEAVRVMDRIARAAEEEAERCRDRAGRRAAPPGSQMSFPEAICEAAATAASVTKADAIVAFSEGGPTALLMSKQRPAAPIFALTPFEPVRRRMALYWGTTPHTMPQIDGTDERVREAERRLKEEGHLRTGQQIVILSGTVVGRPGGTNLMKLHEVR
jgi:pyruvate kinase